MKIKELAPEDRPREKFLEHGCSTITNAELLAILIGSGASGKSSINISQSILKSCDNNLSLLLKLTINDLKKFEGIGEVRAVTILAALELSKRIKSTDIELDVIKNSFDLYTLMKNKLEDLITEEFWVIFTNNSNKVLKKKCLSRGGLVSTTVDLRLVIRYALEECATKIILCHNHPSGEVNPSSSDIDITKKIQKAANFFDIEVIDHIIVGGGKYFSFKDEDIFL